MKNVFGIFQISIHENKDPFSHNIADARRPLIAATKHE